ncbi:MAG: RNA 2',3'-cyclic phosphodiesterase [Myxococcales bacterium]|nr:RNA 2',3'-cyclic phosphodiesterase [Myxococcales bacterium]
MRLFIAVPVPEAQVDALWPLQDGVPAAQWTEPDDHHLTLVFIGELASDRHSALLAALAAVHFEEFSLTMGGLGHFPPRGQPKSLWAGLEKSEPLQRLQRKIERACMGLGLSVDSRKFSPHVTLARLRNSPPHRVAQWLGGHVGFASAPWTVNAFGLYGSRPLPQGAHYTLVHTFAAIAAKPLVRS